MDIATHTVPEQATPNPNRSAKNYPFRVIPDAVASELESEDEYYFWSEDGKTLISEDGKKTIPSKKAL